MIDLQPAKKSESSYSRIPIYIGMTITLSLLFLVYSKISFVQEDFRYLSSELVKVRNTRAALTGTACISCHSPSTPGNMLPLRKLNPVTFRNYMRGERVGLGYSGCPAYSKEDLSDADVSKIYAILYSSGN